MTPTPSATPTPTATPIPTPEPGARIESGDQAYFNGDWDKAILEYTQALDSSTDSEIQAAALLGLGRSLQKTGDMDLAKDSLLTAINTYPQSPLIPVIYFSLGEVYESQGLYVESANAYQDYYNLRPGLIDFYIQERIGDMWFAAKEFNNAIAAYQSALQAPYIGDTLYLNIKIGDAYEALGDIATSLIIYEDVFNRTGDNRQKALMKYYIGWAHRLLGELALKTNADEAAHHLEKSIAVLREIKAENELALAHAGYGRLHKRQGKLDQSREYLTKALEIFDRLGTLIEPDRVRRELAELS